MTIMKNFEFLKNENYKMNKDAHLFINDYFLLNIKYFIFLIYQNYF